MRTYYKHPVQFPPKEERKLLSCFYRQMGRQPREAVPLNAKDFELSPAQLDQREKELIAFLKFNPWQEEIQKASTQRAGRGKEARNIGIAIAVCGAIAIVASPLLGIGVVMIGVATGIAGALMMERHERAASAWDGIKKSAEAQLSD